MTLPDAVTVEGTRLVLNGMGIREATAFNVDVYVAGLYLPARSRNGTEIAASDVKKQLTLRFVREVDRDDIVEAFENGFREAGGANQMAQLRTLNGWMTGTSEGTVFTFTYIPGTGLQVRVGNRVRGVIPGVDFQRVFFSIWLGAHPPNGGLKRGLLGGECG